MDKIEQVLEDMNISYKISDKEALVEFWTDTAGQDIPTEFEFDGTPESFIQEFTKHAEAYDVNDEVELYVGMRGKNGVPNTVKELLDDCQEAKDTLMKIAEKLQEVTKGE